MRALWLQLVLGLVLFALMAGCGGGNSFMVPAPPLVAITASFPAGATPASAAVQVGSGAFAPAMIQNSQISFSVPTGTTRYAIAYVCPRVVGNQTITVEFVIQATVQDSTSLSPTCFLTGTGTTGAATVTVDATAIAGATQVLIAGRRGIGGTLNSTSGSTSVNMLTGMDDVAIIALDASSDTLAVRILRSQNVPGAINGGNTVVLDSNDLTVNQPLMINNVPAGFSTPVQFVTYHTPGGTAFRLQANALAEYTAVPAASGQSGDFYDFAAFSSSTPVAFSEVSVAQSSSGGGPFALTLPAAWPRTPPTPSALPTFTFDYSGFSGNAAIVESANIDWTNSTFTASTEIQVTATSSFQNGSNSITIPDLSSLPGFPALAPSGTNIIWFANIRSTNQIAPFVSSPPMNTPVQIVSNFGSYQVP